MTQTGCVAVDVRLLDARLRQMASILAKGKGRDWAIPFARVTVFGGLLFLKPLADMLWALPILDYALLAYGIVLVAVGLFTREVRFNAIDCFALFLMALVALSAIRSDGGFVVAVKMLSAFLLYFAGRLYWEDFGSAKRLMALAFGAVLTVSFVMLVLGVGYKAWGNASTFTGVYYFKTDLACAMGTAFALFLFFGERKWHRVALCGACVLLVVLSNTRAYYVIILLTLLLFIAMRYNVKVSSKVALGLIIGLLGVLFFLNWLFSTGIFTGLGFVAFRFDSFADLLNSSNTQGRDVIWSYLLEMYSEAPMSNKLFGIDLVSDQVYVNGATFGAHSLYVGMLLNAGAAGLVVMIAFFGMIYRQIAKIGDKRTAYFFLALLIQFLVSGLSVHTLQFTANSWIVFAMLGVAVSMGAAAKEDLRESD